MDIIKIIKKKTNIIIFWISLCLLVLLFCVNYFILYKDQTIKHGDKYSLERDGFCLYKNILTNSEIENLKSMCENKQYKQMKDTLLNNQQLIALKKKATSNQYIFQDYIWIIEKSSVHTCHRDNNGDFFNENQKYPSYTALVYLEDMDKCLGVMPESHKDLYSNSMNFTDTVKNILCNKGDVIIFNANLIHVGTINRTKDLKNNWNTKDDNLRIQLKITHKDDIENIMYYEDFNKVLNQDNTLPLSLRLAQKRLSCMFPILSNLTQQENIRTARGSDNGVDVGIPQQIFSYLFYGNKNFYNLPNAF
jgi:hypothetical protein